MASTRTFDIGLTESGDLPETALFISGFDLVQQRVIRRLRTVLGEWLVDKTVGLPYFTWIAQKPPQVASIGAVLRAAVETTPGVARVTGWTGAFDTVTRALTFTCQLQTNDGDALLTVIPLGQPGAGNGNPGAGGVIRLSRVAPPA